jgi:hypothetical protein
MTRSRPCSPGDPRVDFRRVVAPELNQILPTFGCTSSDAFGEDDRPSHGEVRAVLDVVNALASLDPAGFGLDAASAQFEGRAYVMAVTARPHFCIDRMRRRSYGEDLVDAIGHPSAVSPDAER